MFTKLATLRTIDESGAVLIVRLPDADSAEFNPDTPDPVIATMADQEDVVAGERDMGGTMRLGLYPAALQPGGGTLSTGDYRFLSATWSRGMLWAAGNDGCVPPGNTAERACSRVVQVSTAGTPSLVQSTDISFSDSDVYYPAILVTGTGDVFVSVSTSSASLYASAAAVELKAGSTSPISTVFARGVQTYSGSLWGDYSAIAIDPTSHNVWAAAEYMASGSTGNWGTAAAEFAP